jgi:hypothetical protein
MSNSKDRPTLEPLVQKITSSFIEIVSETNGITLSDTIALMLTSETAKSDPVLHQSLLEFRQLLLKFQINEVTIEELQSHPVAHGLFRFFKKFPIPYRDAHTHLTGALSADFIYPLLMKLLAGPHKKVYEDKIRAIYGDQSLPIQSIDDVKKLLTLRDDERFSRYLSILMLPKLILIDRATHKAAAYHLAKELYTKFNVGFVRLKFSFSRATADESENVPGLENLSSEDVVMGLYDGFMAFKKEFPSWNFVLSPSFRKEASFFDSQKFSTKKEHFLSQCNEIIDILNRHPELEPYLCEVDTVGNESDLYKKSHFNDMKMGLRKLQYRGFSVRSHHGETWHTLRQGIQAVDNAMNIWRIDTLEHGLSLGINPNFYFHSLFQRMVKWNQRGEALRVGTPDHKEIADLEWNHHTDIRDKLLAGQKLDAGEIRLFTKAKFHTAREVESYQHDVMNRLIDKGLGLVALPSSNKKLTSLFQDYKDHPFSYWEKKGLELSVGTDNYVTLGTNFIQELIILLLTDPYGLKITKLLMVATGETRRPYISHLLWEMRRAHFA